FQLMTSNYSAAFGAEAGAQVNLVTKSGSNHFRGSVYEFLRNNKFDANDFFSQTKGAPAFKRNQSAALSAAPSLSRNPITARTRHFLRRDRILPGSKKHPAAGQLPYSLGT